jgi:RNA polymerase sigma factor (sigma-70 family)
MAEPVALPVTHPRFALRPLSESRLASLAVAGDRRAFTAIFERYHEEIYRYCRAILRDPDEAQDALQSTMANALRALPGESRQIALRPWLYRVAHNESLNVIRRRRESPSEALDDVLPPVPAAEATAASRQRLRELIADLDTLPARSRSALIMRELSGLRHEEIALALEITPGAARQAVYEARSALLELTAGREMDCREIRRLISDRDGRVMRGRRVRAHLRSCANCESFRTAIGTRTADLRAIAPPLPAAAASGLLVGLGGAGAGAGGAGAGAGLKTLALVAGTVALGGGAAGLSGVIDSGEGPVSRAGADAPAAAPHAGWEEAPTTAADGAAAGDSPASSKRNAARANAPANQLPPRGEPVAPVSSGGPAGGGAPPAHAGPQAAGGDPPAAAPVTGSGESTPPPAPPGSEIATASSGGRSTTPVPGAATLPALPEQAGGAGGGAVAAAAGSKSSEN